MFLYRVFAHDPTAQRRQPGHPLFVFPGQTAGRWDNAAHYTVLYTSLSPEGAVGEAFGDLPRWSEPMFQTPYMPQARRALAVFTADDNLPLIDMDNADELIRLGLRPSQVVVRDPTFTQAVALRVFQETVPDGSHRWAGIKWWSFHRPHWACAALWAGPGQQFAAKLTEIQELSLRHPAVASAAKQLAKPLVPLAVH